MKPQYPRKQTVLEQIAVKLIIGETSLTSKNPTERGLLRRRMLDIIFQDDINKDINKDIDKEKQGDTE